jgi:hypothetical protein
MGGIGLNLLKDSWSGNYQAMAGAGTRLFLSSQLALDANASFDFFTPQVAPLQSLSARFGVSYFFNSASDVDSAKTAGASPAAVSSPVTAAVQTAPPAPVSLTAKPVSMGMELEWPKSDKAPQGYFVEISTMDGKQVMAKPVTDLNFTFQDALPGVPYKVTLSSLGVGGAKGLVIDEITFTAPDKTGQLFQAAQTQTAPAEQTTPAAQAAPAVIAETPKEMGKYLVQKGDTLWGIAGRLKTYLNHFLWPLIYQANKDQLANPNSLEAGMELKIPKTYSEDEAKEALRSASDTPGPHTPPKK